MRVVWRSNTLVRKSTFQGFAGLLCQTLSDCPECGYQGITSLTVLGSPGRGGWLRIPNDDGGGEEQGGDDDSVVSEGAHALVVVVVDRE